MTLASWPNDGWAMVGKLPDGKDGMRFGIDDDRIKRWATAPIRGCSDTGITTGRTNICRWSRWMWRSASSF